MENGEWRMENGFSILHSPFSILQLRGKLDSSESKENPQQQTLAKE
jgi:hypothetical protein